MSLSTLRVPPLVTQHRQHLKELPSELCLSIYSFLFPMEVIIITYQELSIPLSEIRMSLSETRTLVDVINAEDCAAISALMLTSKWIHDEVLDEFVKNVTLVVDGGRNLTMTYGVGEAPIPRLFSKKLFERMQNLEFRRPHLVAWNIEAEEPLDDYSIPDAYSYVERHLHTFKLHFKRKTSSDDLGAFEFMSKTWENIDVNNSDEHGSLDEFDLSFFRGEVEDATAGHIKFEIRADKWDRSTRNYIQNRAHANEEFDQDEAAFWVLGSLLQADQYHGHGDVLKPFVIHALRSYISVDVLDCAANFMTFGFIETSCGDLAHHMLYEDAVVAYRSSIQAREHGQRGRDFDDLKSGDERLYGNAPSIVARPLEA